MTKATFGSRQGWRVALQPGRAVATPAVAHGLVLVGGGFGSHDFYAFDARSGDLAWHLKTKDDGPTAAVAWDGHVVFNTESCTLMVTDIARGRVVAERWLGDPLLAQPAVAHGRVFMVFPDRGAHWLGAFTLPALEPLWKTRVSHDVISAPVCAEGSVWLSTFDGAVWCVDEGSGAIKWTRPLGATSAPWVAGGSVYVAHRADRYAHHGAGAGVSPHDGSVPSNPVERTARFQSENGDLASAWNPKAAPYLEERWGEARKSRSAQEDASVGFGHAPASAKLHMSADLVGERTVSGTWRFQGSRPVTAGGLLFDSSGDRLEAHDLGSNALVWSWDGDRSVDGERRLTPPAVANGRVWAGTWAGSVRSWDAASGARRWEVPVGAPCHWQPVVADGWVYAGLEDGSLVGFRTDDPADDGWPMWGGGPGHNGLDAPAATAG